MDKISIREFRNQMAGYIAARSPFAVTKHGHTVGYYIPVNTAPRDEDYNALRAAAAAFDKMMREQGLDEETLMQDFKDLRASERATEQ